jgi:hypothetical protein
MQTITNWATRWQLPAPCLAELLAILGVAVTTPEPPATGQPGSEAGIQAAVRLAHAQRTGGRVWRNNLGATQDERGNYIRYGLANDSPQVNKICKSSDLIGITPVTCQCGQRWGVFTALECKAANWKFRQSDERAVAQLAFLKLVVSLGGIGKFIQRVEDII